MAEKTRRSDIKHHRTRTVAVLSALLMLFGVAGVLTPTAASAAPAQEFVGIKPGRVADTRDGTGVRKGVVPAYSVLVVPVAGKFGVPTKPGAVSLNVTVTQPTQAGYLTVYACGTQQPWASNLNYVPGQTVPNAVVAEVGSNGAVCVFALGTTHVVVDVNGYFPPGAEFDGINPVRVADTRDGTGVRKGTLKAGTLLEVPVAGKPGVPGNAYAAVLNVTVTDPATNGFVTVFPCGEGLPTASNLNYTPGVTVPNMVVSVLGVRGSVCVYTNATTHVVVDVNGYFTWESQFYGFNPERAVDTRQAEWGPALVTGETVALTLADPGELKAVSMNVTVTQPKASGFVTVFPCDKPQPVASNLNFVKGQTVANAVLSQVDKNGEVCFYASSGTHLIVDINGVW